MTYAIGVDFGTESGRAVLVDTAGGEILAATVTVYPHGVIDRALPLEGEPVGLGSNWALQDPDDYLFVLRDTVRSVLPQAAVDPAAVAGIGLDFTACTVLPVTGDGTPLCTLPAYRRNPHAWVKLWKHHAAQPQADRVNALAAARGETWLPRYGGKISSEWLLPKALEILEAAPDVYAAAAQIVEAADWVVWQLTGTLARNACCAGYKATWNSQTGYPDAAFLAALHPGLAGLYRDKVAGPVLPPGRSVGGLTAGWAKDLGLREGTPVAAGLIDAHAAALGGGANHAGDLFMIMGTSTCHMLLADAEVMVDGISGVVKDGIVPGFFGYEAGQAGVGDIFAWYVKQGVPADYQAAAASRGISAHDLLSEKAAALAPGESGLLALDWWNGCRTPLVDADLSGVIVGYTLETRPEEIYRALIEATAFGTRLIVELFREAGVPIQTILAGGGLTQNALLMQIYADVTGLPFSIAGMSQASALGAAMLGATAGGAYASVVDAARAMAPRDAVQVMPIAGHKERYDVLYREYKRLVDIFGRDADSPLKRIRALRG